MDREKTGGRQKGTPNKITRDLRKELKVILQSEIDDIPNLLQSIENPEKRLNIIIKLLPYVFPKMKTIYHTEGEPEEFNYGICNGF